MKIMQHDIQFEGDKPVIDVQYQMLNFDGAVPQESVPLKDNGDRLEANDPWMKVSKDSYFPNAYRYTNLLPNELGFNLQADVA